MIIQPARVRIAIDVDGVVADFVKMYLELAARLHEKYAGVSVTAWDITTFIDKEHLDIVEAAIREENVAQLLEVYPGSIEGIQSLMGIKGVEVAFVTAPLSKSRTWVDDRTQWLAKHFDFVGHKKVIHTDIKDWIRADIFVDDKPSHINDWKRENPDGEACIWTQPYNENMPFELDVRRINNWGAVERLARTLLEEKRDSFRSQGS